jgi:dolichol-phosphate mannosyltransferase
MLSIVIPCFNEEKALDALYNRIEEVAKTWEVPYEVIIVDDSSEDNSWRIIRTIHNRDPRWKAIRFSRNFGQQSAIAAGMKWSAGDAVVTMDADLQDPPEIIKTFIKKWREGYEVVYGIRANRKEGIIKRTCYSVYYRLLRKLADTDIHRDSGDFCLIDRKVVDILNSMPERNRFVRGLRSWAGFSQTGIKYDRESRVLGKPKYTFSKLVKLAADGILSFSIAPIRMATILGLIVSAISFLSALLIFIWRLTSDIELPGYATIILSILFIGGMQLMALGIIGEYIGRIYDEVKKRPPWIEKEYLGFKIEKSQIVATEKPSTL